MFVIDILEAYRFVLAELQKKPAFWLGIAAASVVIANIGLIVPQIGGIFIFILAVGLMNLGLRAVHKLSYGIADLVVQPETYLQICISLTFLATYFLTIVMAENFLAAKISLLLGALLTFSFLRAVELALGLFLLGWFFLKIAFVPYYIIDRKLGAAASIVESWRDSSLIKLKVFLAVLLIGLPFYILKYILTPAIDISFLIELLQALAVGHLWVQYMNYKAQIIRDAGKQNYQLTSKALAKRVYTYLFGCITATIILMII
ncbi:MAG: hypothetical protein LLG02_00830 [Pelosinus sp.]|nr:hypothetical protein [Pelosinus sp.]